MPALLIDLDGVIYEGNRCVPGAGKSVAWLRRKRVPFLFVTNTTSRPRSAIIDRLANFGIGAAESEILTPPVAATRWLDEHGHKTISLYMPAATQQEFFEFNILPADAKSGADAVVIGDLGEAWDFQTLNRAFRLLMQVPKPNLIALGMTRYWRAVDGLRLDTAPFVMALSHATGIQPVVVGKPAPAFFETALSMHGTTPTQTYMIGDDIHSDISGSQAAGIKALLVRTGKFRPDDLDGHVKPQAVLDSIAALPDWWRQHVTD